MNEPSSYDLIADLYDDDMGRSNSGADVEFFREYARRTGGPVLEIGCGTGRITLPLVRDGHVVVALDASAPMLRILETKARQLLTADERRRLTIEHAPMQAFVPRSRFPLVICPFCVFTYLVERADQRAFLERMKASLFQDGLLILDSFVAKYPILACPDPVSSFDYERTLSDGTTLRRHKTITQDLTRQVNEIERVYELLDPTSGVAVREIRTTDRIRYMFKGELEYFLLYNGFEIVDVYGDYNFAPYSYEAGKMVFVLRRAAA
jgi:SAM-dependent methyltransferase